MAKPAQTPKSVRLTASEMDACEKAIAKAGGFKAVVLAGIRQINGNNDLTQAQVLEWIKRHAK